MPEGLLNISCQPVPVYFEMCFIGQLASKGAEVHAESSSCKASGNYSRGLPSNLSVVPCILTWH